MYTKKIVYVARKNHLHQWNIPIMKIIFSYLCLGVRIRGRPNIKLCIIGQYLINTLNLMCDFSYSDT
jgi:hypothetical protein